VGDPVNANAPFSLLAAIISAMASATWTLLDKTLDKAISSLRSSKTSLPKGKAALEDLLKKLEQATKP
jgi:hypothetical protein